ncbi:UDP-galactopyranose mutase [Desulfovibrio ferrophilus]|uniref:UDP-galactopyranose mutase n=1 Tax=Desulfovibrio ferrophilus TaxID=241368 RepID=A0A2Z6B188_9BACT|nr:UDP-galactopyranose mutase [Desulfovibrio ferrophilus]BBD09287.1 UDP-galactopyranose mutase [Desulfovibrio ferrophilus]
MDLSGFKYIVVGAGLFGTTVAERIASDMGLPVAIVDRRDHIGGNCHSVTDADTGIECHVYGTHIFHTKRRRVWDWITQFTQFNSYRHKVLTRYDGRVFPMPINLTTINSFYGIDLAPSEVEAFVLAEAARDRVEEPANLEEKAISLVGRPLYEAFIRGYTLKQWETDPKNLPAEVITRLPFRHSREVDYFTDPWQGIPLGGYAEMFKAIHAHENIHVFLNTDYFAVRDMIPADATVIYTGPVDRYFENRFGELAWRTIDFEREVHPVSDYQGTSVMNYADPDTPWTRIHEYRHLHPERDYKAGGTVTFKEFSRHAAGQDDPYYPVNTPADIERLEQYRQLSETETNVLFGGRLGGYKYLDMDTTILAALEMFDEKIKR